MSVPMTTAKQLARRTAPAAMSRHGLQRRFDSSSASNSNGKQIANELYGDTSIFLSKMNPECFVAAARPNFMKAAAASNISYIQRVDRETLCV